ncbi:MAG: SusC/RagA family TonB-linked outer membrane protein [Proteobacteria bacterium]|nr:SusC/RagA family TonB-linked outer membrane protein [Pseudomonadota bacterium]
MFKKVILICCFAALSAAATAQAQDATLVDSVPDQDRVLTGKVEEAGTRQPVVGATVIVKGTSSGTITELDGSFTISDLPPGDFVLQISATSYRTEEVTVAPGQTDVRVQLALTPAEEIIIVGRAPQIIKQNLANGASVVTGKELTRVSNPTVDSALQGRISGANIQSNSGSPGGGMQIRFRGIPTIEAQSETLYVVDGVLISDVAIPSGLSAITGSATGGSASDRQDDQVNRIADLNPNDIASIEVLKGPAAAALYGSKASNGVVIIETKRGRIGTKPRVDVVQRFGIYQLSNTLGSRTYETLGEAVERFGDMARDYYEEGVVFDQEKELAGNTGLATETSASLRGGDDTTGYFASLLARQDPGIIGNTGYEKQSGRISIDRKFGDRLKVGMTGNLIHSVARRGITNNDNNTISYYMVLARTPSFIDLRPDENGVYPENPFSQSGSNPLETAALVENREDVWRFIGGVSANLTAWESKSQTLNIGTNLGVDRFQQQNDIVLPADLHFTAPDNSRGISVDTSSEVRNYNVGINLVHRYVPESGFFKSTTMLGYFYDDRELESLSISSRNQTAGQENVDSGTIRDTSQQRFRTKDDGIYIQEEAQLLGDRLGLVAGLLAERSSANGDTDDIYLFPKAATTVRIPIPNRFAELLRLRVAYGETGNKPQPFHKFTPLDATENVSGSGGVGIAGIKGNPDIKPERQREIEVGVDAVAMDGRVVLELTGYQRTIDDLILARDVPQSTGYEKEITQEGNSLRNRGVEFMVQLTPVRTRQISWLSRTIFSLNRNEITELSGPPFLTGGFGTLTGTYRIAEGEPATQIVGLTADGVAKLGDGEPTFRMSFVNNITIGDFELSSLIDWQQGSDVINMATLLFDIRGNSVDFETEGMERAGQFFSGITPHVEDATFVKLREVSLAYRVPGRLLSMLGPLQSARVSVSGRNLLTLTDYSGLDPEVSNFGNQAVFRNFDVAPFPPSRSFWFSIEAGF